MWNRFRLLLAVGWIVLASQLGSAQNPLYQVGTVDSIYSKVLNESRAFYIQLPPDFDAKQKYPVVYLLDGGVFLPTLSNFQDYYSGGFTPEMILVGISNSKNRTRDLTTSTITTRYGMPFQEENGQAENFLKFLSDELIPLIESKYPVTNYRTLIGHSYGGLFAIYTLLNRPDLFANYLSIDPSLSWDDQQLLKEAKTKLASQKYQNKSLFISLGGQLHLQDASITIDNVMQDKSDYTLFARSNIAFTDLVRENSDNGISIYWKFYPNDLHGTIPFPSIMDGMISMFKWYQMENTDKINSFDTPKEELLEVIKHREQKLAQHFGYSVPPYPEYLFNMVGFMNMEMQKPDKAKMYFELAIKYFPESANAYDAMADYYEAQGELQKALQMVTKALELSGNDYYQERIDALKKK